MEIESSLYTDFIFCNRAGLRNIVHDKQQIAKSISMHKITKDIGELTIKEPGEAQSETASSTHQICLRLHKS
uniref:Uncharacterized protein n=1 Tax=Pavo cristatus TaxID=9049 RepID=A0A8C9F304_PAVCR